MRFLSIGLMVLALTGELRAGESFALVELFTSQG